MHLSGLFMRSNISFIKGIEMKRREKNGIKIRKKKLKWTHKNALDRNESNHLNVKRSNIFYAMGKHT